MDSGEPLALVSSTAGTRYLAFSWGLMESVSWFRQPASPTRPLGPSVRRHLSWRHPPGRQSRIPAQDQAEPDLRNGLLPSPVASLLRWPGGSLFNLSFLITLAATLAWALGEGAQSLAFGVPLIVRLVLCLPLMGAALTLPALLGVARAWQRDSWTFGHRLRLTLHRRRPVALSAVSPHLEHAGVSILSGPSNSASDPVRGTMQTWVDREALGGSISMKQTRITALFLTVLIAGFGVASGAGLDPNDAAGRFAGLALDCVHREYPNKIAHVLGSDGDVQPPRQLTPVFFGCYDWHSAVHGHWLLARLARSFPGTELDRQAREALDRSFIPQNVQGEVAYLEGARQGFLRAPLRPGLAPAIGCRVPRVGRSQGPVVGLYAGPPREGRRRATDRVGTEADRPHSGRRALADRFRVSA